jgi:hypothetical protein
MKSRRRKCQTRCCKVKELFKRRKENEEKEAGASDASD